MRQRTLLRSAVLLVTSALTAIGCFALATGCERNAQPVRAQSRPPVITARAAGESADSAGAESAGLPGIDLVLPPDVAARFAAGDECSPSLLDRTHVDQPAPPGPEIALSPASLDDTDRMVRGLFVAGIVPPRDSWHAYAGRLPEAAFTGAPRDQHARAPLHVSLTLDGGQRVALDGFLWRDSQGAGLWARATGAGPDSGLEYRVPWALVNWPAGALGMARVTREPQAGGLTWGHHAFAGANSPIEGKDRAPSLAGWGRGGWPCMLTGWSDGAWVRLTISAVSEIEPLIPQMIRPDFVKQPDHPRARGTMVGPHPKPTPGARLGGVASATGDLLGTAHTGTASKGDSRLDLGLCVLTPAEWAGATEQAVPPAVVRFLALAPDARCVTRVLRRHPVFGNATVGLLHLDVPGDCDLSTVQWALDRDRLWVTALSPRAPAAIPTLVVRSDLEGCRRATSWVRRILRDDYGRRVSLVPADLSDDGPHRAFTFRLPPDTAIGILGEERVGDQPWGKCSGFVDAMTLHLAFELPKGWSDGANVDPLPTTESPEGAGA